MNSVNLTGRMTKEAEVYHTQEKMAIASFNLAVDKILSKEKKEEYRKRGRATADFIPIRAFGRNAEIVQKYLVKGSKIAIEGRIEVSHYKDKVGTSKMSIYVIAEKIEFLESVSKKETECDRQFEKALEEMCNDMDDFEAIRFEELPF